MHGKCCLTNAGIYFQVLAALGLSNAVSLTRQMHVRARFISCPIAYLFTMKCSHDFADE